jgi:hypothetical protein
VGSTTASFSIGHQFASKHVHVRTDVGNVGARRRRQLLVAEVQLGDEHLVLRLQQLQCAREEALHVQPLEGGCREEALGVKRREGVQLLHAHAGSGGLGHGHLLQLLLPLCYLVHMIRAGGYREGYHQ